MRKLNLSEWASLAEVVGAIGVVVSLIYVGVQIRDNTSEVRAANRQQLVTRAHMATNNVATTPELAAAFAKVAADQTLSPEEQMQYGFFIRSMLYDIQEAYLLYLEGGLDEDYWQTRAALVLAYMQLEEPRKIYDRDKSLGVFHPDYTAWLDSSLAD